MSSGIGGLGGVFSRALDGLNVAQRGLTVTSNNIANVNTEGYARQTLIQGSRPIFGDGSVGGGVFALGVSSVVDPFIERQLANEMADWGTLDGRRSTLQNIETVISDLDGKGLGGAINSFFTSWSDLSQNPQSGSVRSVVREKGRVVADMFKSLSKNLNNLRTSLSQTIDARTDQINQLTAQIADLNRSIVSSSDQATKAELKNQRNLVLRNLSAEIGVNYFENADGAMVVQVEGSGFALVDRFQSSTLTMVDNPAAGGTVQINGTLPGSGSGTLDLTSRISSGRLAGNLMDRNDVINNQIADLDALAYEFTTQMNAVHQNGYGLDSVSGRNFFAPVAGPDGAAAAMALDNSVLTSLDAIAAAGQDPTVSGVGDSENARALIALQSALTMEGGTKTFSQYFTAMGTSVGILSGQVKGSFQAKQTLVDKLQIQRENISAVNLDEEASDLIRYQKAFEASTRVLSIANDMMDSILGLTK